MACEPNPEIVPLPEDLGDASTIDSQASTFKVPSLHPWPCMQRCDIAAVQFVMSRQHRTACLAKRGFTGHPQGLLARSNGSSQEPEEYRQDTLHKLQSIIPRLVVDAEACLTFSRGSRFRSAWERYSGLSSVSYKFM